MRALPGELLGIFDGAAVSKRGYCVPIRNEGGSALAPWACDFNLIQATVRSPAEHQVARLGAWGTYTSIWHTRSPSASSS